MRRLRKLVAYNFWLKSLSLVMALLLWYYVRGLSVAQEVFELPVRLEGLSDDLIVISDLPRTVRTTLTSKKTVLQRLDYRDLAIALDMSGAEPGTLEVILQRKHVTVPPPISVGRIAFSPESITLRIDDLIERDKWVKPIIVIRDGGRFREEHVVRPQRMRIRGPRSQITVIKELRTERIVVPGAVGIVEEVASLVPLKDGVSFVGDPHVRVSITISERTLSRTFQAIQIPPPSISGKRAILSPSAITVTVEGERRVVESLGLNDLKIILGVPTDARGAYREGTYSIVPTIGVPSQVKVVGFRPETITITITGEE